MEFIHDDGGRADAGYKGTTGDCATRAIAVAAQMPYKEAYILVNQFGQQERTSKRKRSKSSARTGVYSATMRRIMSHLGWKWTPTMTIGSGCRVHLVADELPPGRLIASVSKHYTAIIDGVIHDTYNPSERGTTIYPLNYMGNIPAGAVRLENGNGYAYSPERCVYGYWTPPHTTTKGA